jgi:peptidoglycan-associated lipoprotein
MTIYSPFTVHRSGRAALTFMLVLVAFVSACGEKHRVLPPPPPPTPAATGGGAPSQPPPAGTPVIAEFSIEPSTIERGQSAVLRWNVTGSNNVAISNGLGTVPPTGTQRITPQQTTSYVLTAGGPGGDASRTATVTVTGPAPPPATNTNTSRTTDRRPLEARVQSDLQDALYDYDSNNIRDDARVALTTDAESLKRILVDFPTAKINIEGHCDERGSAEYNLGLGDRRATSAKDFLVQLGVPADRLMTISYGKERPVCTEGDESCWQRNRRAHFSVGQ